MPTCGLSQVMSLMFQRTSAIKHENYLQLSLLTLYLPHKVVSQVLESTHTTGHNISPKTLLRNPAGRLDFFKEENRKVYVRKNHIVTRRISVKLLAVVKYVWFPGSGTRSR